jgi:hypothetical protein
MSTDWIPQLMDQMLAERNELTARIALLDGARHALRKVYPALVPQPAAGDGVTITRVTAIDQDGVERDVTAGIAPAPAPAPLPTNNRKPRVKPANGKAATATSPADQGEPTPAATSAVSGVSHVLSAYDQETLTVLRANNGLTISELADKMGWTYSTAWARLRRLKDAGLAVAGADKFWRAA